jgi:FAD/FMN-containing dehydrogenase
LKIIARMYSQSFTNFGGNESFTPATVCAPRDESDLLDVLRTHRGRRIRAIGRLHSWSAAPVAHDVLIDLRHLDQVHIERRDGRNWVAAGGGCQIKRLLAALQRQSAGTLPSMGLITEQTIAGAISTGTHGSGNPSMSNFADEIRVATYDAGTGEPIIRTINAGDELRAARCALGSMGIIVSVGFWARPAYRIEEHFQQYDQLADVLAHEHEFPLQQFFLMPWSWRYIAQHRCVTEKPRGGWARLYRWYFFLQFDIGLHLLVRLAARQLRSPRLVKFLFRQVAGRLVVKNWRVVDEANQMLVMEHELFQHIECELFVQRSRLPEAIDLAIQLLKHFGEAKALDSRSQDQLRQAGCLAEIEPLCGSYTHHYPICVRRVWPDDTLISMASGSREDYYALSFISYAKPADRQGFLAFATCLTRAMGALFDARPHWGKVCPLSPADAARLYPQLPRFREICTSADPSGIFRNDWIARTLFDVTVEPTALVWRPS